MFFCVFVCFHLRLRGRGDRESVSGVLTDKMQLKAFAGIFCIANELQPHGARGGVEGGV